MGSDKKISIVIGARDQAGSVLDSIKGKVTSFAMPFTELNQAFELAQKAYDALKPIWEWSIGEAAESEKVYGRLRGQLEQFGYKWDQVGIRVENFTGKLALLTKYTDEDLAEGLRQAAFYTSNLSKQMLIVEDATKLAAAKTIDITTAIDLLGKAAKGRTETLVRYGIVLDDTGRQGDKFAQVHEFINKNFGKSAQDEINNYLGKYGLLKKAWGEFGENIGKGGVGAGITDAFSAYFDKLNIALNIMNRIMEIDKELKTPKFIGPVNEPDLEIGPSKEETEAKQKIIEGFYANLSKYSQTWYDHQIKLLNAEKQAWVDAGIDKALIAEAYLKRMMDIETEHAGDIKEQHQTTLDEQMAATEAYYKGQEKLIKENLALTLKSLTTQVDLTEEQLAKLGVITEAEMQRVKDLAEGYLDTAQDVYDRFILHVSGSVTEGGKLVAQALRETQKDLKLLNEFEMKMLVAFADAALKGFGEMNENLIQIMEGGRNRLREIWKKAAGDFLKYFITAILEMVEKILVAKLLVLLLSLFDTPANDRMAAQQGADFAKYFSRGLLDGIGAANLGENIARRINASSNLMLSPIGASTGGQSKIEITIINPIGTEDFVSENIVPALEKSIRRLESRVTMRDVGSLS